MRRRRATVYTALVVASVACSDSTPPTATSPTPAPLPPSPVVRLAFQVEAGVDIVSEIEIGLRTSDAFAGAPISPTIEITLANGLQLPGEIAVSLSDDSSGIGGPPTSAIKNGVARFPLATVNRAGQVTLRATLGASTASSRPFNVLPSPRVAYAECFEWDSEFCTARAIVVLREDGTARRLASSSGWFSADPAWSPDGKFIVVAGGRGCQIEGSYCDIDLYLLNVDDGTETRITHGEYWAVNSPSWSPDGRRIAFSAWLNGQNLDQAPRIYIANRDGSGAAALGDLRSLEVAWSPDGRRIAYTALSEGVRAIWTADVDGTRASPLTRKADDENDQGNDSPAWSPDGRRIAFSHYLKLADGLSHRQIWLMNADGSSPVALTDISENAFAPAWSPDGNRIVYTGAIDPGNGVLGVTALRVMQADGSGSKLLRRQQYPSRAAWAPVFSPE